MIIAFRCHTLLGLDDCLYALQPTIPQPAAGVQGVIGAPLVRVAMGRAPSHNGSPVARQAHAQNAAERGARKRGWNIRSFERDT